MIQKEIYSVHIELIEDLLGTVPLSRDVYSQHIANKKREELTRDARKGMPLASGREATDAVIAEVLDEEVQSVQDMADPDQHRGWTTFHRDAEGPFLYDYHLKGNLCEAARALKEWGVVKQLQDKVKRYVFVAPRKIRLPEVSGQNERPLRAQTAQGPRVTVVRSDTVCAGTQLFFDLIVVPGGGITKNLLEDVLSYGELQGLCQWRSGGWGRFTVLNLTPKTTKRKPSQ